MRGAVAACAALLLACPVAQAQSYPSKPVRLVVTSPPGGSQDFLARLLAQGLSPALGQQVVVENRTGASGIIGIDHVVKSARDGYTLLLGAAGTVTIVPAVRAKVPFDPLRDLTPISMVASGPFALAVHPSVPARTLSQLVSLAKAKPRALNYGSSGAGASPHLATELFQSVARIEMVHIPYKGVGPALSDLVGGQIDLMFADVHLVRFFAEAGRLRPLAVAGRERSRVMPEVPTVIESGYAGYTAGTWFGVFAPMGTPEAAVTRLNGEIAKFLSAPLLRERLLAQGMEAQPSSPEALGTHVRSELAKWREVVTRAGIKSE